MSDAMALPACAGLGPVNETESGPLARHLRWARMMEQAQAGDARAYEALLRECLPLLRATCRARLRNAADAEDAVQETLLSLHKVRHTYDPARPFRPWLLAIAERRVVDRMRQLGRQSGRARPMEEAETVPEPGPGADEAMGGRQVAARLREAARGLPEAQRTAVMLTKVEELSLIDASLRSGMSVGALKVATHRALHTLRRHLTGEG